MNLEPETWNHHPFTSSRLHPLSPIFSNFTQKESVPLDSLKFITDVHLGKLAKYLRLCGFDTFFRTDLDDAEIIDISLSDNRVILTRDKELVQNRKVTQAYRVLSERPYEQLKEVLLRYDLKKRISLFKRCMECNGEVREVPKKDILERLQPRTRQYFRKFSECPECKRIYWNGSHYQDMKRSIKVFMKEF